MPSPELLDFTARLRARVALSALPLSERRQQLEWAQARLRLPADLRTGDVVVNGRPARWFEVPESRADHCVLYLHGGAYTMGSIDSHAELMARIARAGGCRVLGLDYRLAPEHPFPAARDDAVAAWRWLLAADVDPARSVIAGDSAGGGLALSTLLTLRDTGVALPAGAVLLSPWADLTGAREADTGIDVMLDPALLQESVAAYAGTADHRDPGISPCYGDFRGLPPLLVQVGTAEMLYADARRIEAAARGAGIDVDLQVWEDAFHVFQSFPQLPESAAALDNLGAFFRRVAG